MGIRKQDYERGFIFTHIAKRWLLASVYTFVGLPQTFKKRAF